MSDDQLKRQPVGLLRDGVTYISITAPNPATVAVLAGQLRTLFAGLAGMGLLTGLTVTDDKLTAISAMLLTLGSIAMWVGMAVWSAYQKWKAKRLDQAASEASAIASAKETIARGEPTPVVVTVPSSPP